MKELLELLERKALLAPESGEGTDAGSAALDGENTKTDAGGNTLAGGAAKDLKAADHKDVSSAEAEPNPAETGEETDEGKEPSSNVKNKGTLLTQDTAGEPGENKTDVTDELVTPEGMEYAEGELDEFKQITSALSSQDRNAILAWQAKYDAVKSGQVAEALDQEVRAFIKRQAEENKLKVLESWGKDPAVRAKREADVARAVRQFATDEFKKLMDETGLGNHPAVVATFEAVGKAFGEDRVITGHRGEEAKDLAHRMFPNYK